MTVADSGDGVPEALRDILFEENVSGHPAGENGERGLGLALVRQVARVADGDVGWPIPAPTAARCSWPGYPACCPRANPGPRRSPRSGSVHAGTDRAVDLDGRRRR